MQNKKQELLKRKKEKKTRGVPRGRTNQMAQMTFSVKHAQNKTKVLDTWAPWRFLKIKETLYIATYSVIRNSCIVQLA